MTLFAEHAKEAGPNALSKHDFGAEIMKAMSSGDKHEVPQVVKAAKLVRPFFEADHAMLQKIAPDADYAVMLNKTAESYFPRVSGHQQDHRGPHELRTVSAGPFSPTIRKTVPVAMRRSR